MSLTQRRLLFYFFILLFIIVVPIVLIFATGRTINWQRFEFQKTATLIIDSQPSGASVYINGQPPLALADRLFNRSQAVITKTKLTGILPGTYTLRLESNGYIPWEQQITLQPGQVLNTGTLRLFAQAKPKFIAAMPLSAVAAADGRTLAALNGQRLSLFQIPEGKSADLVLPFKTKTSDLLWSADGEELLIGSDFVVDRNGQSIIDLRDTLANKNLIRWDQETALLYAIDDARIIRINPKTKKITLLRDIATLGAVEDLQVRGGNIFLIASTAERSELIILSDTVIAKDSRSQLKTGTHRFISVGQEVPTLLDITNHDLYLIERPLPFMFAYRLTLVSEDYRLGYWRGSELVYATSFELRRWRENEAELLLARWSEALTDVRRVPDGNQVVFATPTTIQILPNDEQSFRPAIRLASVTAIKNFVSVDEKMLFFIGTIEEQTGLFSLEF